MQKVPANRAIFWLGSAFRMVRRDPYAFLGMGLIYALIGLIPLLGPLTVVLLGPALLGGMIYAGQFADNSKQTRSRPQLGAMFRAFQGDRRLGSLLALSLPAIGVIGVGLVILGFVVVQAKANGSLPNDMTAVQPTALLKALMPGLLRWIPLLLVLSLLAYAMTFFGIARAMLEDCNAWTAMGSSVWAAWKNLGAFLLTLLLILAMSMLAMIPLMMVLMPMHGLWIASLLYNTALYALLGPTLYFAWKDVFGPDPANQDGTGEDSKSGQQETVIQV